MDASARLERLLGLITLLLNADRPVSFRAVRESMPEYAGLAEASAQRKFERDKAALTDELGIPIRYVEADPDEDEESGYVLEGDAYYLPDLDLSSDELAALFVAGTAARAMAGFPWPVEVARALEKIRFAANAGEASGDPLPQRLVVRPPSGSGEAVGRHFAALRDAVARQKRARIAYRGLWRDEETVREVDPFGLFLRERTWCLFGHCHLRNERRTFHLDRIASVEVNAKGPRTPDFEVPSDVDLAALARLKPWQYPLFEPVVARLRLAPRLAFAATRLFGAGATVEAEPDGSAQVAVEVRHPDAFLEHLLGLRDGVVLLEPDDLKAGLLRRLDAILEAHPEGASP
jgi:proteasome accessory factor B